jgi:succinate-semialdehyde dehydrogenase/glutarate-semialdehyde dehydrogenase
MSIATSEQAVVDAVTPRLFVGGRVARGRRRRHLRGRGPATGEVLCEVADGTPEDGMAALDAAVAAQAEWAAHPPRERGEILRRGLRGLNDRADDWPCS